MADDEAVTVMALDIGDVLLLVLLPLAVVVALRRLCAGRAPPPPPAWQRASVAAWQRPLAESAVSIDLPRLATRVALDGVAAPRPSALVRALLRADAALLRSAQSRRNEQSAQNEQTVHNEQTAHTEQNAQRGQNEQSVQSGEMLASRACDELERALPSADDERAEAWHALFATHAAQWHRLHSSAVLRAACNQTLFGAPFGALRAHMAASAALRSLRFRTVPHSWRVAVSLGSADAPTRVAHTRLLECVRFDDAASEAPTLCVRFTMRLELLLDRDAAAAAAEPRSLSCHMTDIKVIDDARNIYKSELKREFEHALDINRRS